MGSGASSKLVEGVKGASQEELKDSVKDLSAQERTRILSAIAMVELSGAYRASASDGDWGDYDITITFKSASEATVKVSNVCFRDSPGDHNLYEGSFSVAGDIVTFTSSKVTDEVANKTEEKVETMKFKIQSDGSLAKVAEDGSIEEIQGGYAGEKVPAILKKQPSK